ncbi:hypothetical protein CDAR_265341 [Caerostris darwini]|uniref:Uncharacterized protein n=1 Tax=Caerostris darwini TaxID=1538125 RepID=A0AAV4W3K0_9ARAC|nr:hypothetical protein CDAR_265341 [Caerostris darwini]
MVREIFDDGNINSGGCYRAKSGGSRRSSNVQIMMLGEFKKLNTKGVCSGTVPTPMVTIKVTSNEVRGEGIMEVEKRNKRCLARLPFARITL